MTQEPGWQLDPNDSTRWRWWDGTRWTEHVAPVEHEPAATQQHATEQQYATEQQPASEQPHAAEQQYASEQQHAAQHEPAAERQPAAAAAASTAATSAFEGGVWNAMPTEQRSGEAVVADHAPVWEVANDAAPPEDGDPDPHEGPSRPRSRGITVGPAGLIATILAVLGSLVAFGAGASMATLSSVAGNTVAESFYNAFGWAIMGGTLCFLASFIARARDR